MSSIFKTMKACKLTLDLVLPWKLRFTLSLDFLYDALMDALLPVRLSANLKAIDAIQ